MRSPTKTAKNAVNNATMPNLIFQLELLSIARTAIAPSSKIAQKVVLTRLLAS